MTADRFNHFFVVETPSKDLNCPLMVTRSSTSFFPRELVHFVVHLRWHYQLFILSGGFLLGGFMSASMNSGEFLFQFVNVHLLLFGGATAYNSYWDRDTGPVGGLKNPPPMKPWMHPASLILQAVGWMLAWTSGLLFSVIYLVSAFFFWLYSTPLARWKGKPVKSLFAIGISTGTNSFLMGYLAAGNHTFGWVEVMAAFGVALMMLSLYPISQIYQREEDAARGDRTFAVVYGARAVIHFFLAGFGIGLLLVFAALYVFHPLIATIFGAIGLLTATWIWKRLKSFSVSQNDYHHVMQLKYGTSLAFVLFLIAANFLKHGTGFPG